ncbi:MAG: hypothetical protein PWP60_175 [Candidatus Atribacteria bacterium]|jgi:hypothetical protein|uniref:Iron-only hydrogenase system regulator n=1 Tax=Thermatribacter velox TaxID=3039681 RepID=A0ABZ2YAS0_9BACT|nr:hypothetical protein [Candidatus Atribacteria bacterium]MDI3530326.1 hypothetical protein [Candidatus Atribacteria bacterium]
MYRLLILKIAARSQQAPQVQEILTQFGCNIKTRLGLHEASPEYCAEDGLVILELTGKQEEIEQLKERLQKLEGVTARYLEI